MKSLVSILIPAYNAGAFLGQTLESALAQSWTRKEIIVVNDASTDATLSVAKEFASRGVRVVSHKSTLGASAARNKAFSLCQGDYIQWLDADDLLAPDKIEKQMAVLAATSSKRILASSAWGKFMYRPSKVRYSASPLWNDISPLEFVLRKWENNVYMQTATWLVSRELSEAAGPWNTTLLGDDDGEYFCRVVLASEEIRFVPEAKVYYRVLLSNSLSHVGFSNKKLEAQFRGMCLQIGEVRAYGDTDRIRRACLHYLQSWFYFFYPNRPDLMEQAQELAATLGGRLQAPQFSWKYAWIRPLFGATLAKRASMTLPRIKALWLRSWDKALFNLQKGSPAASSGTPGLSGTYSEATVERIKPQP